MVFSRSEWYGEVGTDLGRDIWGETRRGETVCIQCANHRRLSFRKVERDIRKIVRAPNGVPHVLLVVAGGRVGARTRDRIKRYAKSRKIATCHVWSGAELEERLRFYAESLLRRFCYGEKFPDSPAALRDFVEPCPLCRTDGPTTINRLRVLEAGQRAGEVTRAFRARLRSIQLDFATRGMSGAGAQLRQELDARRDRVRELLQGRVSWEVKLAARCCAEHREVVLSDARAAVATSCASALSAAQRREAEFSRAVGRPVPRLPNPRAVAEYAALRRGALRDIELATLRLADNPCEVVLGGVAQGEGEEP